MLHRKLSKVRPMKFLISLRESADLNLRWAHMSKARSLMLRLMCVSTFLFHFFVLWATCVSLSFVYSQVKNALWCAIYVPIWFINYIAMKFAVEIFYGKQASYPFKINKCLSQYNKICATSEDSDQPAHPRSLIRVFADRMCLLQPPGYPKGMPYWVDV